MDTHQMSYEAINKMIAKLNLKHKFQMFPAEITVYDCNDKRICETEGKCSFQDNIAYMETKLNIEYDFNDDIMHYMKLRGYYGTNFQRFTFEDDILTIIDEDNDRIIEVKGMEK